MHRDGNDSRIGFVSNRQVVVGLEIRKMVIGGILYAVLYVVLLQQLLQLGTLAIQYL